MRRQAESYILTTNGFLKKLSTDAGGGGGGAAIIFVGSRKSHIRPFRIYARVRVRRMAV